MNHKHIESSIGLDRLATGNEVHSASLLFLKTYLDPLEAVTLATFLKT